MNMSKLCFATGNKEKAREVSDFIGFTVTTPEELIEISEVQLESKHWDEAKLGNYFIPSNYIATRKAIDAEKAYDQTVLISDVALYIPALDGRPGTNIKAWCSEKLMKMLCEMAYKHKDNRVSVICTFAISIKGNVQTRHGRVDGTLSKEPIGDQKRAFGWDRIFRPENSQLTYAQDIEQKQNSHRARALKAIKNTPFNLNEI